MCVIMFVLCRTFFGFVSITLVMIFIAAPNLFKNAMNFRKSAVSYFFLLRYDAMRFMLGRFILGRFLVDFGGHAEI